MLLQEYTKMILATVIIFFISMTVFQMWSPIFSQFNSPATIAERENKEDEEEEEEEEEKEGKKKACCVSGNPACEENVYWCDACIAKSGFV
jgi:flagellar biosynthesis/type III secretory pathway M-ring protein FliF/YscJ